MKDQLKTWEVVTIVLSGLLLMLYFTACNPVKQARRDAAKAARGRLDLARLCSEMFPAVPTIKTYPGSVDTAGLIKWWLDQNPYYPDSGMGTDSSNKRETLPMVAERGASFSVSSKNTPCPERQKQPNKDSLIAALKRFIKPERIYETKPDSALTEVLKGELKAARDSTAPLKQKVSDLQLKLSKSEGKASTRLWMFIASLAINAGVLLFILKGKGISTAVKRIPTLFSSLIKNKI